MPRPTRWGRGAPAEAQRSTRKGYAVSVRRQSERSGACGDAVTLRVGRMAGSLSLGSAKNAAPGCARRLFFRLRPVLAPLCAYPPRFSLSRCSRCHAAGWAHGRVAKSGLREKCRSGLCPSPVFSPAPCLSSPMRLPSALLAVTLRLFATPGFPPAPGTNSQFANWPGLYPSLRSIRAAHGGSALLFRQFPQKFFRNLLKRAKRTGIIERQCM